MSTNHLHYFKYLKSRSLFGKVYRFFYLYPFLSFFFHGRVLDIGCGVGDFLKFRPNTTGADINSFNIEFCRSHNLNAFMIENGLPFSDSLFDGVLLDNVIEHILDPHSLLNDISRVLMTNGTLIIGVPGRSGFDFDPDHKVFYDDNLLLNLVQPYGFSIAYSFSTPFLFKINILGKMFKRYCVYYIFKKY